MEHCSKDKPSVFGILGKSLSSYKPHIKSVDPQKAPKDRAKKHAFL
ncbi:hypothetical protein HMPREF8579_1128 [Streptococcus oralis ATCC 35037]|nr:hypothetical protein HMPREF8579_1128 [Streptococcus oralis ATCC 35037]